MKRAYIFAVIFSALAIVLNGLVFFGAPMPLEAKMVIALGLGIALLYIGAAVVFLLALKGYTHRLKVAYRYICASMFLVSIGTLQFLVLGALDAINSPWVAQGWASLPFVLMATLAYLGVRIFAKLVHAESVLANNWVAQGLAVGMGVIVSLVAAMVDASSHRLLELPMILDGYQAAMLIITVTLVIKIKQVTGPLYASALSWSVIYNSILAIAGVSAIMAELLLPADHWYHLYNIGTVPYFIGGLCVMVAAVHFNRVAYAENIHNTAAVNASHGPASPVDVVVFLARFVSNQNRVGPMLDKMRVITATMEPGKPLSDDKVITLADTYVALEDFLVTQEPVRQYKQSDLRQMIELRFRQVVDERFWQRIQGSGQHTQPAQQATK